MLSIGSKLNVSLIMWYLWFIRSLLSLLNLWWVLVVSSLLQRPILKRLYTTSSNTLIALLWTNWTSLKVYLLNSPIPLCLFSFLHLIVVVLFVNCYCWCIKQRPTSRTWILVPNVYSVSFCFLSTGSSSGQEVWHSFHSRWGIEHFLWNQTMSNMKEKNITFAQILLTDNAF